jgi:hypothetical protein
LRDFKKFVGVNSMILTSLVYETEAGIAEAARMLAVASTIMAGISGVIVQTVVVAKLCKRL